ncbi:MAG: fatty acid desaturase [Alphaproteobacteria bacterium]
MRHPVPSGLNLALTGFVVLFNAAVLFALPLLLARSLAYALLLLPLLWVNNMQWGLIHEAVHKILHPNARTNEWMGRLLAAMLGASFVVLRFGHLMHHRLNRDWHCELIGEKTLAARAKYYLDLVFGLFGAEVVASFLFAFLPRGTFLALARATFMRDHKEAYASGVRFFYERGQVNAVRADVAGILVLYTGAFLAYGRFWPVLLAFIALRGLAISFMDNIYHYATPADNSKAAKELTLPRFASALLLNSNYHETHHLNPLVPWTLLPQQHAAQGRAFDGTFLAHGLMQFAGPVSV